MVSRNAFFPILRVSCAADVFEKQIANEEGQKIPALPIPIDSQFRKTKKVEKAPRLGSDNNDLIKSLT